MKRILLFFYALLMGISGVWATDVTVSPSTGTYMDDWDGTNDGNGWAAIWKSNATTPDGTEVLLKFSGESGMNETTGDIYSNQTYTLQVPAGYTIISYSFNGTATEGDVTITPDGGSGTLISDGSSLGSPLFVSVGAQTTTFALSGTGHITNLDLTVTLGHPRPFSVTIANNSEGNLPSAYGSFSDQTFTTAAASGLAGVTLTASSGLTIGEQTVNVSHYGKCFKFVTAAAATNYTVTLSAPNNYVITGYYLACSANTKDAVHTLTSEDGTVSVVASAPPYNSPNGPKVFEVTGLNTQTTSFTINTANKGNTLYVPSFIITLKDMSIAYENVTYVVKDVSNNTLFTSDPVEMAVGTRITTLPDEFKRTLFYTYNTVDETVSATNTTIEFIATPKSDAPVKYTSDTSNPFYYNLKIRGKYIVRQSDNTIKNQDESEPFNPSAAWAFIGNPYGGFRVINQAAGTNYFLMYDEIRIPKHAVECVIMRENDTRTWIIDTNTGGFVLRATENSNVYLHQRTDNGLSTCSVTEWSAVHNDPGSTIVASTDEQILIDLYNTMTTTPVGEGVNQYTINNMTLAKYQSTLSGVDAVISGQITSAYADAYQALLELRSQATFTLNLPSAGFYRIKGKTSGKYLAAGLASNNKFAMTDATDATTIFYYDGSKLVNYSDGMVNKLTGSKVNNVDVSNSGWNWTTGLENGSDVVFLDGSS